jgi:signal transduction histidine kinase
MKILPEDKTKGILTAALAVLLLALLLNIVGSISPASSQPKAEAGLLDLSRWDLNEDGMVQLAGEWEFFWNQLLTKDDFVSNDRNVGFSGYQTVPDVWNEYDIGGKPPDGMGFATYRLRVKLADVNESLGLKIRTMSTSYRIYIDGRQAASAGTVGTDSDAASPEYKAQVVSFIPSSNEFEIIVQVSNFTYARGGIWRSISLGTERQVRSLAERAGRMESFTFSALLLMACYHIFLYLIQKRNIEMIYISVAMLVTAARFLVTGQYYITELIPGIPFSLVIFMEYMTIFWNSFFLLLFSSKVYPEEFSRRIIKINIFCVLFTVFILVSPLHVYTNAVTLIQLLQALLLSYNFTGILIAVKRRRHDAPILFISVILIVCNFIINRLSLSFIILDESGALTCTMVAALLLQAYILAKRYNKAFDESREYSRELERLSSIKDELIANTTHELRTPLNGIISVTESILHDGNEKLAPKVKERLDTALVMEHSLSHMIEDVSDFVRMSGNRLYLEKNTFEIAPLIDNMISEVITDALRKGVSVRKYYHDGAVPFRRINTVLRRLFSTFSTGP